MSTPSRISSIAPWRTCGKLAPPCRRAPSRSGRAADCAQSMLRIAWDPAGCSDQATTTLAPGGFQSNSVRRHAHADVASDVVDEAKVIRVPDLRRSAGGPSGAVPFVRGDRAARLHGVESHSARRVEGEGRQDVLANWCWNGTPLRPHGALRDERSRDQAEGQGCVAKEGHASECAGGIVIRRPRRQCPGSGSCIEPVSGSVRDGQDPQGRATHAIARNALMRASARQPRGMASTLAVTLVRCGAAARTRVPSQRARAGSSSSGGSRRPARTRRPARCATCASGSCG